MDTLLGLMVLSGPIIPLLIYFVAAIVVISLAISFARKHGRRGWVWGLFAAFVMYNLVFWDWIPTVVTHQYYCAKESGFWVYKTLDQWRLENPGVMERLVANKVSIKSTGDDENHTDTQVLNQRFQWVTEKQKLIPYLPIYRWQSQVVDTNNGAVISRWIDFSRGKGRDYLKFWLNADSCPNGISNRNNLYYFADELIKMTDTFTRSAK